MKNIYVFFIIFFLMTFIYYKKWSVNNNSYDLLIPMRFSDVQLFFRHLKFYKKYLNYSKIILIGPSNISDIIVNDSSISLINEEDILEKKN